MAADALSRAFKDKSCRWVLEKLDPDKKVDLNVFEEGFWKQDGVEWVDQVPKRKLFM